VTNNIPARLILSLTPKGKAAMLYRFNHPDCPAGEDTKQRLYIRIPDDNLRVRLAYCHNCGGSGFARLREDTKLGDAYHKDSPSSYSHTFGTDTIARNWQVQGLITYDKIPPRASQLLINADISEAVARKYKLGWSGNLNRLTYPNQTSDGRGGDLVSMQMRAIYESQSPKYLTWYNDKAIANGQQILNHSGPCMPPTLVITEDLLSAIRVNEAHQHTKTLPLFGTHISTDVLYERVSKHQIERAFVWLDNDGVSIGHKALDITSRLEMLGVSAECVFEKYEPKHTTDDNIREVLRYV